MKGKIDAHIHVHNFGHYLKSFRNPHPVYCCCSSFQTLSGTFGFISYLFKAHPLSIRSSLFWLACWSSRLWLVSSFQLYLALLASLWLWQLSRRLHFSERCFRSLKAANRGSSKRHYLHNIQWVTSVSHNKSGRSSGCKLVLITCCQILKSGQSGPGLDLVPCIDQPLVVSGGRGAPFTGFHCAPLEFLLNRSFT